MQFEFVGGGLPLSPKNNTSPYCWGGLLPSLHALVLRFLRGSPVQTFLSRVDAWEHTLTSLQDIIDNWLKVQAAWLYLEPIFSSDDITRQLPTESSMFTVVNGVWIESMAETAREPAVLSVARREGLLDQLTDANEKLDVIQKLKQKK